MEILDDFGGDDDGIGQVCAVFKVLVAKPCDVQILIVSRAKLLIPILAPAGRWVLFRPDGKDCMPLFKLIPHAILHELPEESYRQLVCTIYTYAMAATPARTAAKRTYSLNSGLVGRFEELVPVGERSKAIEDLLAKRVEEIEMERLNAEIREGLVYMSEVYTDTAREWRSVDAEGWPAE